MDDNKQKGKNNQDTTNIKKSDRTEFADEINVESNKNKNNK